jgi:hypothetical protein
MEKATESILLFMLNKHYIGGKHFPEHKLLISRIKWLSKEERKIFEKEYDFMINKEYIIRLKKRTSKSTEWHISINPEKLKDVFEMMNDEKE